MNPLRQILDEYIVNLHKDDEDRTLKLHVTDITGRDPAAVYYEKTGHQGFDENFSRLRRFELGHIYEKFVLDAIQATGVPVTTQGKLEWGDPYNLVGSYDILVEDEKLIEVKSIHPFALDNMKGKPHPHYIEQLNTYLGKLEKQYGSLFYLSLDGRTEQFEHTFDPVMYQATLEKAKVLSESIKSRTPPKPLPTFIQEDGVVWKLNWKIEYAIRDGFHQYSEEPPSEPDKWISSLKYQAKKMNNV